MTARPLSTRCWPLFSAPTVRMTSGGHLPSAASRLTRRAAVRALVLAQSVLCLPILSRAQSAPVWRLIEEQQWSGEAHLFTRLATVLPTGDGSILVPEIRERRVRVFGGTGTLERTIGRDGQGPGEFVRLNASGLLGDTLWVTDLNLRRTSYFRTSGDLLFTEQWKVLGNDGESSNLVNGLFADGTAWGERATGAGTIAGTELPKAILRLGRAAEMMDTLAVVSTEHTLYSVMDGPTISFGPQPFSDAPIVVGSSSNSRLYVIDRSVAKNRQRGAVRVIAVNARGDTAWTRDLPYTPRPLARRVADSVLDQTHRRLRRSGASVEVVRRILFLPNNRPPLSAAFAAHDGTLWLRREVGQATVQYWVISVDGNLAGSVTVPSNVSITAASRERVWAIRLDDDEVPSVVQFRISK